MTYMKEELSVGQFGVKGCGIYNPGAPVNTPSWDGIL